MSEIKSLIDDDVKENIDHSAICVKFAMMSKQIENKDKEIERLNNIINKGKIYCEDVIQEHENGEYNVSTTQLAIEEHKKNIISLLNILNGDLENYWRSDKE